MKFRYKVLFTNLILLSLGLGLVGYLMIHKNFELAKQTQLKNAIVQNNLVQSSVEYELLQLLNSVSDNSETSADRKPCKQQCALKGFIFLHIF